MKEITFTELQQWAKDEKPFELIDVREDWEHEHFNIGGKLIPLGEVVPRRTEIETEGKPAVFYCKAGVRSLIAIQRLQSHFPNADLYNLKGGVSSIK